MRYCQSCGKEQDDDAVFCGNCGAKLDPIDADVEESTQEHSGEELASEKEAEQESAGTDGVSSAADNVSVESASVGETTDTTNRSSETTDKVQDALEAQKTEQAQQTQVAQSTQQTQGVPPTQQTESDTKGKDLSRNRLIGIIVAAIVVVIVVVIILVVALGGNSGPSDEQVETDIEQVIDANYASNMKAYDTLSSDYINESPFTWKKFQVDNPDDSGTYYHLEFTATAENNSFEVTFTGSANYSKSDGAWKIEDNSISVSSVEGKPINGINKFSPIPFSISSQRDYKVTKDYQSDNFDSPLDEPEDGVYQTTAKQDIKYDLGFATESLTSTQEFTFENSRWKSVSDPNIIVDNITWNLLDKVFETKVEPGGLNNLDGDVTSSLIITEISEDNSTATIDYAIEYSPSNSYRESFNETYTYNAVPLSGTANGKLEHLSGSSEFTFDFNDETNGVTISGTGEENTLIVNLTTNETYCIRTNPIWSEEKKLELRNCAYNENTSA